MASMRRPRPPASARSRNPMRSAPVTGGNAAVAGGFAALNLGSLDQVYGVGRVQGGPGSTLGGLVGSNNFAAVLAESL